MFSDRPGVGHMGNVGRHGGHYILQALNILSLRFVAAAAIFLPLIVLLLLPSPTTAVNVLTQHNDNFRTGADLEEFVLTTSNLSAAHFGKVFSRSVDGHGQAGTSWLITGWLYVATWCAIGLPPWIAFGGRGSGRSSHAAVFGYIVCPS